MREQRKIGVLIAVFVLVAAGLGFWRWQQGKEAVKLDTQIAALKKGNAELQAKAAEIPAAEKRLAALQKEGEEAKRVLPEGTRPYDLIGYIKTKMEEARVSIIDVNNKPPRTNVDSGFEQWEFTISMRGDYDQIATFINKMESFERVLPSGAVEKRFFRVDSIDLTAAQNGFVETGIPQTRNDAARHSCKLVMQTFRYLGTID